MSTTSNTEITPSQGWVKIYTGPTDTKIEVEKSTGSSTAYLAIATDTPELSYGHLIVNGQLKGAVLGDGESLYVRCIDALLPSAKNIFTITG
jgi:hypothetical protein